MDTVPRTVFNPAQLYLLDVFSTIRSDDELLEIKKLISDYYSKRLDGILDEMWKNGELDQERLDQINDMDLHEWLRNQKQQESSVQCE